MVNTIDLVHGKSQISCLLLKKNTNLQLVMFSIKSPCFNG